MGSRCLTSCSNKPRTLRLFFFHSCQMRSLSDSIETSFACVCARHRSAAWRRPPAVCGAARFMAGRYGRGLRGRGGERKGEADREERQVRAASGGGGGEGEVIQSGGRRQICGRVQGEQTAQSGTGWGGGGGGARGAGDGVKKKAGLTHPPAFYQE